VRLGLGKKQPRTNKQTNKKIQWSTTKKMDYDEPHLTLNEKKHGPFSG
jgi:hypothetical protein